MINVKILYEDKHVIVCVKPAGMPSQSDRSSSMDLVSWLKNYLASKEGNVQKGVPYVSVVHRLDRPVGGVMVYAKTKKAAESLSRQFMEHQTQKNYLAVLTGSLGKSYGTLEDQLLKDGRTNTSKVVASGGKRACLDYRVLEEKNGLSLVNVTLHTGRHHQIRVQMAHAGAGIYGDMKYNRTGTEEWNRNFGTGRKTAELCLFSSCLTFEHPISHKRMEFKVLPEVGFMTIDEWESLSYYE
ncbi:RluA family pseudouridine synthase [Frisingicoccus sp.]|uniref:RluA family pseudouridine synthase n=1 Tax=Frisingicoccus sp. TaxID=1918627 RepID=UPI00386A2F19